MKILIVIFIYTTVNLFIEVMGNHKGNSKLNLAYKSQKIHKNHLIAHILQSNTHLEFPLLGTQDVSYPKSF